MKNKLIPIVVLVIMLLFVGCFGKDDDSGKAPDADDDNEQNGDNGDKNGTDNKTDDNNGNNNNNDNETNNNNGNETNNNNGNETNNESPYPLHDNITVTLFWIGEEAKESNGWVPNTHSAWDDLWMDHYGGVDDPDNRDGYYPADFMPKENPFYFAMPYNDFNDNGNRKSDVSEYIYWYDEKEWTNSESMCKNQWIKIYKGDKIAYAQYEDTGPFREDDSNYVFGEERPLNEADECAGLDVSPAVRDYLALKNWDLVHWQFIDFTDVPEGPWKDIVTKSQVHWI